MGKHHMRVSAQYQKHCSRNDEDYEYQNPT
jgi:hypothetical protein